MTPAVVMAFLAAAAAVAGAWDVLAALERARVLRRPLAALRPLAGVCMEGGDASPVERRRLAVLACVALLAAGWLAAGPVAGVLAGVTAPALTGALLAARRRARRARLALGAAPTARALAAALGAGRSVRTAIGEAADAVDGPTREELRRTAGALAAGEATEAALEALRARAGSRAWDTLVAAVLLQRDAGGDLPELLRDLAMSLEAAARADGDARAATAQARFTARLVAGLPMLAVVLAELASPGWVARLLSNPLSAVLVAGAAVIAATAMVAVRRIMRGLAAP